MVPITTCARTNGHTHTCAQMAWTHICASLYMSDPSAIKHLERTWMYTVGGNDDSEVRNGPTSKNPREKAIRNDIEDWFHEEYIERMSKLIQNRFWLWTAVVIASFWQGRPEWCIVLWAFFLFATFLITFPILIRLSWLRWIRMEAEFVKICRRWRFLISSDSWFL